MNQQLPPRRRSRERGAVIIQVSIALLALTALSAIVVDYGIEWTARGQAQNAADAGALSAAFHMMNNPTDDAGTIEQGQATAHENAVWNEAPASADVLVEPRIDCPPGSSEKLDSCVRVDVMRGATDRFGTYHANTLPTLFAHLLGVTSQGVSATATAEVTAGNAVQCIKPWIIADKWTDSDMDGDGAPYNTDSWDREDFFDPSTDDYDISNGFNPTYHTGYEMPLKPGNIGTWSSGWAMEIDFGQTGSSSYQENIEGCPTWVPTVGIYDGEYKCDEKNDVPDPERGCISVKTGVSQGPTSAGVNNLIALDQSATWVSTGGPDGLGYVNSPCMTADNCEDIDGNPLSISPRIVPIATFNTQAYYDLSSQCSGTTCVAQVSNLVGFFLRGMCDEVYPNESTRPPYCGDNSDAKKTVIGILMRYPGQGLGVAGPTTSSFVQRIRLVR